MGSVSSGVTCFKCGYKQAHSEYYYKSEETYIICPKCGYQKKRTIRRNINDDFIMSNEIYEVDGKTVGYSKLKKVGKGPDLSDFIPLFPKVTQKELDKGMDGMFLIKLDENETYGIKLLSFWNDRTIVKKMGFTYLHHTHPIVDTSTKSSGGVLFKINMISKSFPRPGVIDLGESGFIFPELALEQKISDCDSWETLIEDEIIDFTE